MLWYLLLLRCKNQVSRLNFKNMDNMLKASKGHGMNWPKYIKVSLLQLSNYFCTKFVTFTIICYYFVSMQLHTLGLFPQLEFRVIRAYTAFL